MRKLSTVVVGLLVAAAVRARADEAPPPPAPYPAPYRYPPPYPPPSVPPPPPYQLVPPDLGQIDALEAAGMRKRHIGSALMYTGGGLILVGSALAIAGAWDDSDGCHWHDGHHHDGHACGDPWLSAAGAITTLVGVAALVPGIYLYVAGGKEVARAHRLRRGGWGTIELRPTVGPGSAGVLFVMNH